MKLNEQELDQMERYLENKLQGPDQREFKKRLETDSDFQAAFEEVNTMVTGIKYAGRNGIKKQIERLEQSLPEAQLHTEAKVVPINRFKSWSAAAAAVLLIAFGSWWLLIGNLDQSNLFESYYQPYANVEQATTRSTETLTTREQAYAAYDRGEYQQAIDLFAEITPANRRPVDNFYTAISHLAVDNPQSAELILERYTKNDDMVLQDQALWYLALAKLAIDKQEESRQILHRIVQNQSYHHQEAEALLSELN